MQFIDSERKMNCFTPECSPLRIAWLMQTNTDDDSNATSLTLLQKVRQTDESAWHRLVTLYNPLVLYWAKLCGLQSEYAADMAQEVWASVAKSIPTFQRDAQSGSFRGWLWTIARNKARDAHRKRWSQNESVGGPQAQRFMESVPEYEPVDSADAPGNELLRRALELVRPEFESHTWQAFERLVLDGWSAAQTAESLNMKANAVHQARFRVLRRLRHELAGLESIDV